MPSPKTRPHPAVAGLAAITALAAVPAAADAKSAVRFVHAVPGAGKAELQVVRDGHAFAAGGAGFGAVASYAGVPAGALTLELKAPGGGKTLATSKLDVADGKRYTVVALLEGDKVVLKVFPDGKAVAGKSRLRVVHAVPELGSPDIRFDGKTVARKLAYEQATPYLTAAPGDHEYAATKPGSTTPMLKGKVTLKPSTAYTAFVVGSRGEAVHVVPAVDAVARHTAAKAKKKAKRTAGAKPGGAGRSRAGYTVRPGDSLWKIAERQGGADSAAAVSQRVVRLWNANSARIGTGNPNLILPGTHLRLT